jgi:hypothetical protein
MDIVGILLLSPIALLLGVGVFKVVKFFMSEQPDYEYKIVQDQYGVPVETVISKEEK